MNANRVLIPVIAVLACAALVASFPAAAQMYKWTDERGNVSYSNAPPPNASQKKVEEVADRVSVYTTDEETKRAMSADARRDAKVAKLERQLEAERTARSQTAPSPSPSTTAARQAALYQRCINDRRVDCESLRQAIQSGNSFDYAYQPDNYVYAPVHVIGTTFPQTPRPFFVDPTPPPLVGTSTTPPVGAFTTPRLNTDNRAPMAVRSRTTAITR
jgi:hypothetical protein